MTEDTPLWELLGYSSEEEFIKDDEKEKEQILRDTEQAKANEEEVLKAIESGKYTPEVNIQYPEFEQRTFDEIIDKFAPVLVGLKGDSYKTATKMIFYSVLANQLKRNTFVCDGKELDLRIPLIIMMKAGHGKKSYESFIKKTIRGIDKMYAEPTSYVSEQFVGKVLVDESKDVNDSSRYQQVEGFLGADFVVVDEAFELLTVDSQNHQETLKYIRTSLDPIGDNEVEKKQVAIPYDYRLRYFPEGTIVLMTQIIDHVNEKLLIKGSFRRFALVIVQVPPEERIKSRESGQFLTNTKDINKKIWETWIQYNKKLSERKITFTGKQEDFKIIDKYVTSLRRKTLMSDSHELDEFTQSYEYNLKYLIFKMAAVRACIEQMNTDHHVVIERRNIESAIDDCKVIWEPLESLIRQKMIIQSTKPIGWKEEIHGWIENELIKQTIISQQTLIQEYIKYAKEIEDSSDKTLSNRINKAIKELHKWGIIQQRIIKGAQHGEKEITLKSYI